MKTIGDVNMQTCLLNLVGFGLLSGDYTDRRTLPLGIKRTGWGADHSPSSSEEVKDGGDIPPLSNTSSWRGAWLLRQRDDCTLLHIPCTIWELIWQTAWKCNDWHLTSVFGVCYNWPRGIYLRGKLVLSMCQCERERRLDMCSDQYVRNGWRISTAEARLQVSSQTTLTYGAEESSCWQ